MSAIPDPWPSGVEVLILPSGLSSAAGGTVYSDGTLAFFKELKTAGVAIALAEPPSAAEEVASFSDDFIGPTLVFLAQAIASGAVSAAITSLWSMISGDPSRTRMRIRVYRKDGEKVERFDGDGPATEVRAALEDFLK